MDFHLKTYTTTHNRKGFSTPAKLFHWITVLLLFIQYTIGWVMPDVHKDTQPFGLISLHLSIGSLIVLVVLIRLVWRLTHTVPPESTTLPPPLQTAARATHWLLYALLVAFPLMGWANASSRGWEVSLFGLIPLPPLSPTGSVLGHEMGDIHQVFAWVLLVAVGLHVSAALFHHFIIKDDTLRRMLPRRR
jgi:cytochrome b561